MEELRGSIVRRDEMIKWGEKAINRLKMKDKERGNRVRRERRALQRPRVLEIDTIVAVDWSWSLTNM